MRIVQVLRRVALAGVAVPALIMVTAFSCGTAGPPVNVENGSRATVASIVACRMIGTEASAKVLVTNKETGVAEFLVQMTFRSPANNIKFIDNKSVIVGRDSTNYVGFGHVFAKGDKDLRCTISRFAVIKMPV